MCLRCIKDLFHLFVVDAARRDGELARVGSAALVALGATMLFALSSSGMGPGRPVRWRSLLFRLAQFGILLVHLFVESQPNRGVMYVSVVPYVRTLRPTRTK
ncbi:hypothetical protein CGRA01v4_02758 [Colletotrichum graminicola]|nr:hypothetical protein CGRA01v4_02758 [Colletotrichum graminicola]